MTLDPRLPFIREIGAEVTTRDGRTFRVGTEVFVHDSARPPEYPLRPATITGVLTLPGGAPMFEVELPGGLLLWPPEDRVHVPGEEPRCRWCRSKEQYDRIRGNQVD